MVSNLRSKLRRGRHDESGAALVELAVVFMLLMTIALGAYEFGMGFRDSLAVSSAVREAARVAGAAGDRTNADCLVLEAAAGALHSVSGNQVAEVWVYRSDVNGTVSNTVNIYRPRLDSDNPLTLRCFTWTTTNGAPWLASSRDNDGTTRDWLGVKIFYDHEWKTGFAWWRNSVRWQEAAVVHLEPSVPGT
jgi:Flp pilus assembly protein TadG